MSSHQDKLNSRRELQKPEMGVTEVSHHTCSTYIQYNGERGWTKQWDSRYSTENGEEKEYKAETPIHPKQGQDPCRDPMAKSRAEL